MRRPSANGEPKATLPRVLVRVEQAGADPEERSFTAPFRIGRGEECELRIDSSLVSRVHAEAVFEDGIWWLRDRGSTNGMYVDGRKTEQVRLDAPTAVQLGHNAPTLRFSLGDAVPVEKALSEPRPARTFGKRSKTRRADAAFRETARSVKPPADPPPQSRPDKAATSSGSPAPDPSLSQVIERYFDDDTSRPAGEHTMMIRRAYATVKKKEKRKYTGIIAGVLALFVLAAGYGLYQTLRNQRMEANAAELFQEMKQQDLEMARLRNILLGAESDNDDLARLLDEVQERRQRQAKVYDGYVKELGLYRKLSDEERLIYQTARIFNESEFGIPAGFVREVRRVIREHWQGTGKLTFEQGIRRANENGYTPLIVRTMDRYGLPPEFFYLALQESRFEPDIVGPWTRWGIAKGMWQFIPDTGQRYGLRIGPRADTRVTDEQDERHDVEKATDAAARYLLDIYSTPAQASGLLVMASYNWGERRVINKLKDLPSSQEAIAAAFEGIPEDPNERNYWRFLTEYADRMPEETKDYVLKIFSAAVIGQDPRRFGFDFDNPLKPYIETPPMQTD